MLRIDYSTENPNLVLEVLADIARQDRHEAGLLLTGEPLSEDGAYAAVRGMTDREVGVMWVALGCPDDLTFSNTRQSVRRAARVALVDYSQSNDFDMDKFKELVQEHASYDRVMELSYGEHLVAYDSRNEDGVVMEWLETWCDDMFRDNEEEEDAWRDLVESGDVEAAARFACVEIICL